MADRQRVTGAHGNTGGRSPACNARGGARAAGVAAPRRPHGHRRRPRAESHHDRRTGCRARHRRVRCAARHALDCTGRRNYAHRRANSTVGPSAAAAAHRYRFRAPQFCAGVAPSDLAKPCARNRFNSPAARAVTWLAHPVTAWTDGVASRPVAMARVAGGER